ncbi:MAG: DMT family transporter [Treponema sp.]|jgi:drug/metabolite transporter (DMT)-like permease|nr:DMT family transporter [Treponema sp.]
MTTAKDQRLGQGAVFLCAVLWSTSGLFIKLIDWHPVVIAGTRSLVAALFMGAFRGISPRRRRVPFRPLRLLGGGLAYSATMLLFCAANKLTTSANAILLQYSAPIWAALLGWALAGEKPRPANWVSLAVVMGGLCLFFKDGLGGRSLAGAAAALLSGVCFGANSVFMRLQKEGDPADSMLLAHILTAAAGVPFFLARPPAITPAAAAGILFMGVIQIGAASLLFAYGIRRLPAVRAMLTAVVEPVLNPVWVLAITGEKPALGALLGGAVIIAAVLISTLEKDRPAGGPGSPGSAPPVKNPLFRGRRKRG